MMQIISNPISNVYGAVKYVATHHPLETIATLGLVALLNLSGCTGTQPTPTPRDTPTPRPVPTATYTPEPTNTPISIQDKETTPISILEGGLFSNDVLNKKVVGNVAGQELIYTEKDNFSGGINCYIETSDMREVSRGSIKELFENFPESSFWYQNLGCDSSVDMVTETDYPVGVLRSVAGLGEYFADKDREFEDLRSKLGVSKE